MTTTTDPTALPAFTFGTNSVLPTSTVGMDRPLTTLLASAQRLTAEKSKRKKSTSMGWQDEAWDMYDLVGEQRFLATTLAGRLSQARFYIGEIGDQMDLPEPTENERVGALLNSIGDTHAGRSKMMERLEINLFVAGEGWLAGIPPRLLGADEETSDEDSTGDDVLDLHWRTLSVSEISSTPNEAKVKIQWDEGLTLEVDPDEVYLIRVWNPHPRKWWEADSSTRASLSVLRELVGLTMHISAQVDSRLAGAGILFVPQSARRAILNAMNLDETSEQDPFTEALIEGMMTPIEDRSSAAALVPLTITVPDESIEKFRHMSFSNELDSEARELRAESIRRLALGQDAPPEVLLGTAGMNHWGAWLVREDVVTTHLEPPLALICDALTTQFLWPVLESWGMSRNERQRFVFWYDVSDLVTRPNRSQDAFTLHERGAISDDALRRVSGFDETDAPEESEGIDLATSTALDLVRGAPSLMSNPGLPEIVRAIRQVLAEDTQGDTQQAPSTEGEGGPSAIPQTDGEPAEVPET